MSWQQHSPRPTYNDRKTNFLNKSGGQKSSSFNSSLDGNGQKIQSGEIGSPLSKSLSELKRPGGSPNGSRVPLHLQGKLAGKAETRRRGVTVATTSDDNAETRLKDMLGPLAFGEEDELTRGRSKSYEVLPSWDYTPFTVKVIQESSIGEYIKDEVEEESELRGSHLYKTPPLVPPRPPSMSSPGSSVSSSPTQNSSPSATLSGSFSMDLSQSPDLRESILSSSASLSPSPSISSVLLSSSISSSPSTSFSPSIPSPITASLSSSSSDLIPSPRINLTSSNGGVEITFTQTLQGSTQKLTYEKHPDDPNKFIVNSGPKQELLEHLCNKNKIDLSFVNTFVLTFRYYTTVNELFDFLISKFYIKPPTTQSNKVSKQIEEIITSIKQNVIIILSVWIDSNFSDFQDDHDLYDRLLEFTNEVNSKVLRDSIDKQNITKINILELYEQMKAELLPILMIQQNQSPSTPTKSNLTVSKNDKNSVFVTGQQIIDWISKNCDIGSTTSEIIFKKLIKVKLFGSVGGFVNFNGKVQKELFFFVNIEHSPLLKSVHSKQFLDYNPQDLAKQLTVIEFKMFQQIRMKEIYFKSWTEAKTKHQTSPNIMKLITFSNRIANWVATEVVTTPHIKKRVEVLKRFITLAEYCKKFNNYNTLMEVVSGLNNSSVIRLKDTWKNLPTHYVKSLNSLQNFLNTNENWKFYRQALKSHEIPCLPYLGLFLQDINFVEDGNSNTVQPPYSSPSLSLAPEEEFVNFKKMLLLSNVFLEIQYYQKHPYYTFTNQPHIQLFLENDLIILPDKELYDFSKFIESPTNPLNKYNKYIV